MNIYILTPIYAITTESNGATPVVHYFAREWAKQGHTVTVFHFCSKFPKFFYWFSRKFQHQLNTRLGMLVPTDYPHDEDYSIDGVHVIKKTMTKIKPHSRYNKRQIQKMSDLIGDYCTKKGIPDYFVGHWDNPQLELLCELKKKYHRPIGLVFHNNNFSLEKIYGKHLNSLLNMLDVVGFRNATAQKNYEMKYGKPQKSFIAYSGVSNIFIDAGKDFNIDFSMPINKFIFVGSLIERKYPKETYLSLVDALRNDFSITFVGDGAEKEKIENLHSKTPYGEVSFTGRIAREEIVQHLKQNQVFVMVSKNEIFGLVYLEAMALGLIPIASRGEGIDGIIKDGENGFLCDAGNKEELTSIFLKIHSMSSDDLRKMSKKAKETAANFSDANVALKYLQVLHSTIH